MAQVRRNGDREQTAKRLLTSSVKNSFDPELDIDWDAPLLPGKMYMPYERVSLYGTDIWNGLTEAQRGTLSRHELASISSVGLWFEVILLQLLSRYVYDRDPLSAHTHYALTEIGDETRHIIMFAKAITKFDVPAYGPPHWLHHSARLFKATSAGPSMFASVLVAEEITDRFQRAMMDDERIQPTIRMTNRIHVVEEARHVRFAREEVVRQLRTLSPPARELHRWLCATVAYCIVDNLINPKVYASVGLDPSQSRTVALANPHHHETRRWMGERVTAFLREIGIITGPSTALWRKAHLI
ncbi:MAG: AurF N-oxygenase family protein [Sciscionella sp.]